jgi:hypothetical protein
MLSHIYDCAYICNIEKEALLRPTGYLASPLVSSRSMVLVAADLID